MMKRKMVRANTLFFAGTLYQDSVTKEYFTVPVTNPPTPQQGGGVPVDLSLTGTRLRFTLKNFQADPTMLAVMDLDNLVLGGVAFPLPVQGQFTVTGSALSTQRFPDSPVHPVYSIQYTDPSGGVHTAEVGRLTINPNAVS
jgi:hypothetical protein